MSRHGQFVKTLLTEGMGGRLKRRNGQLVPLKQRISEWNYAKRAQRIQARSTLAAMLVGRQNQMALVLNNYFSRGFLGRLKFLVVGR